MRLRNPALPLALLMVVATWSGYAAAPRAAVKGGPTFDAARAAEIERMLPEKPAGIGRPITDRAAWVGLAGTAAFRAALADAEQMLGQPVPEQSDDLFLVYSKTGDRNAWQKVAFDRRARLTKLTVAECVENKGRFLPKIKEYVDAICAERTWVWPAHDGGLASFNGKAMGIDLGAAELGWLVSTSRYLLADRLDAATSEKIKAEVRRRIVDPYLAAARGTGPRFNWMTVTNNWNAVCHAGVIGAILATADDRRERAEAVAAAEFHVRKYFLAGFTPDGYCSEGLGYWNYGFGMFIMLAETVHQATGGKVDFFAWPEVAAPAMFGANIQVINGVAPAFADCKVYPKPDPQFEWYVNRRFGIAGAGESVGEVHPSRRNLLDEIVFRFPTSASRGEKVPAAGTAPLQTGARTWFEQAGVLISRPLPGAGTKLGVALKGGHNAEHHNHNDLGSFVAVVGEKCPILDPGPETYTARTFSGKRYVSKLLNSYGHPVPMVAGQLQKPGGAARATVVKAEFTDAADTLVLDITSAYPVPALKRLERTFVYSRAGAGSLTVTDRVTFAEPQTFSTALITLEKWKANADGTLTIGDEKAGVTVKIEAKGAKYRVADEVIEENAPVKPTRIGIELEGKVSEAEVTTVVTPK